MGQAYTFAASSQIVTGAVLILGCVPRISVPVARSFHKYGIFVDVATFSKEEHSPHSRAVRNFVRVPSPDESPEVFVDAVCELIAQGRHQMLIPGNDVALTAVFENYDKFAAMVHVSCPPPTVVARILDKSLTLEFANRCGIKVPKTRIVRDSSQVKELASDLGFPFVLKPAKKLRDEEFKVMTIRDAPEIARRFPTPQPFVTPLLAQEYCDGEGVGVEMLVHRGECVASFQHKRLKELPYNGGVSVTAVGEAIQSDLAGASALLLRELGWSGVAMVEFRVSPTRGAFLMEVNGRYWGTVSLPLMSGLDFPMNQWRILQGEPPAVFESEHPIMRWRWTAGYVRRMHGLLVACKTNRSARAMLSRELRQVFEDFGSTDAIKVKDSLWASDDPLPALLELWNTVRDLIVSDARAALRGLQRPKTSRPLRIERIEANERIP
jgi:predicted ATP-grasp superfamily ATP-dependent carboligase